MSASLHTFPAKGVNLGDARSNIITIPRRTLEGCLSLRSSPSWNRNDVNRVVLRKAGLGGLGEGGICKADAFFRVISMIRFRVSYPTVEIISIKRVKV